MSTIPDLRGFDNGLPANIDAERTILGAVLLDNSALTEAEEKLRADDFSLDSHRRIFLRMMELGRAGGSVDIVTLANLLAAKKEVESVGGVAYLASLTEGLPRRPVINEYIAIIHDKSMARRIMAACSAALSRAEDQSETALEVLGKLQSDLTDVEQSNGHGNDLESVGQWLNANDVFAERLPGIFTGIEAYDELTYGLHDGELTVVGARTAMGKTSHACTLTWQIARRGKSVAVFLNEQHKKSFIGRMLCARANVSFKSYRRGTLDWVEKEYLNEAVTEFKTLPIFWDSRSIMSITSIRGKSKRLKRSEDLDVILIDQLTGVSNEGFWEKGKRGDEIIGDKVKAIKVLGMDLSVPVILYHQVGRQGLKNKDSRPTLADLQDSGKIEQSADNVDFLHRPSYYERTSEEPDEIIRAKCRDGETGIVKVEFVPQCCKWRDRSEKR